MKATSFIFPGLLAAGSASAATNLIVIGNQSPSQFPLFGAMSISSQANLVVLIGLVIGLVHLFFPRVCWWFKWGWRFANSEPSALWLFFERAGGVIILAAAVFAFYLINFMPRH